MESSVINICIIYIICTFTDKIRYLKYICFIFSSSCGKEKKRQVKKVPKPAYGIQGRSQNPGPGPSINNPRYSNRAVRSRYSNKSFTVFRLKNHIKSYSPGAFRLLLCTLVLLCTILEGRIALILNYCKSSRSTASRDQWRT